jgi:hypothetical protein
MRTVQSRMTLLTGLLWAISEKRLTFEIVATRSRAPGSLSKL